VAEGARFQDHSGLAAVSRVLLQRFQEAAGQALAAGELVDVQALELGGARPGGTPPAAGDGRPAHGGRDQERAMRRVELPGGRAARVIGEPVGGELFPVQGLGEPAGVWAVVGDGR